MFCEVGICECSLHSFGAKKFRPRTKNGWIGVYWLYARCNAQLAKSLCIFRRGEFEMLDAVPLAMVAILLKDIDSVVNGLITNCMQCALQSTLDCFFDYGIEHFRCPDGTLEMTIRRIRFC